MNRLALSALGLAGTLALIAEPVAAQHRRGGEGGGGNGEARGQSQQQSQPRQQSQPSQPSQQGQPSQQAQSGQRVPGWRQPPQSAQPPVLPRQQSQQPAQAPPSPPPAAPGSVPRQGFERAVPLQGGERTVPRQDVDRAVPRQNVPRQGFNGRYDNRRYGYAAPRYIGPRYYSGRYYGPRYVGPTFTVAPRRFYRPYYIFHPRLSVGFGIWAGYPIAYYDPFYYPYDYYPYAVATPGYVAPPAVERVDVAEPHRWAALISIASKRDQSHDQTADALRAVDQNAFDVRGRGRTRYQHRIPRYLEAGVTISLMQVANDPRRIEQDDEVLGEISDGVHL